MGLKSNRGTDFIKSAAAVPLGAIQAKRPFNAPSRTMRPESTWRYCMKSGESTLTYVPSRTTVRLKAEAGVKSASRTWSAHSSGPDTRESRSSPIFNVCRQISVCANPDDDSGWSSSCNEAACRYGSKLPHRDKRYRYSGVHASLPSHWVRNKSGELILNVVFLFHSGASRSHYICWRFPQFVPRPTQVGRSLLALISTATAARVSGSSTAHAANDARLPKCQRRPRALPKGPTNDPPSKRNWKSVGEWTKGAIAPSIADAGSAPGRDEARFLDLDRPGEQHAIDQLALCLYVHAIAEPEPACVSHTRGINLLAI